MLPSGGSLTTGGAGALQPSPYVKSFFNSKADVEIADSGSGPGPFNTNPSSFAASLQTQHQQHLQQLQNFQANPTAEAKQPSIASIYDVFSSVERQANTLLPQQQQPQTPTQEFSEYDRIVTVFGFPAEASSVVLGMFRNFGNVVNYEFVGNTNWMHIEYERESQARMAARHNGSLINETTMIGVMLCSKMRVKFDGPASGRKSASGTPLSSIISPMKIPSSAGRMSGGMASARRSGFRTTGTHHAHSSPAFGSPSQTSSFPTPSRPSATSSTPFRRHNSAQQQDDVSMASPMSYNYSFQNDQQQQSFDDFGFAVPSSAGRKQSVADIFGSSAAASSSQHRGAASGTVRYPSLNDENTNTFQPKPTLPLSASLRKEETASAPKEPSIVSKIVDSIFNWG
jgi:hypothetical protein